MHLSDRLRVEMALFGVRPHEVAARAKLDKGYVSRILAGKQPCPPATVRRLVDAIHADVLNPAHDEGDVPAPVGAGRP